MKIILSIAFLSLTTLCFAQRAIDVSIDDKLKPVVPTVQMERKSNILSTPSQFDKMKPVSPSPKSSDFQPQNGVALTPDLMNKYAIVASKKKDE